MNTQYKKDSNVIGILVIIMTVFAMSFADAIVKYVSSELPLWQIYVVRSLIAIPIISVVFFGKNEGNLSVQSMKWVILRSLLLTFMYVAIYAATPILSLSVIGASLYTGPLFLSLIHI